MTYLNTKVSKVVIGNLAFFMLCFAFKQFVTDDFAYQGYLWDPSFFRLCSAVLILNVIMYVLPLRNTRVSSFLLNYHFIFPMLPILMLYGCMDFSWVFLIAANMCFLLVLFFGLYVMQ